jgi:hypothetical protein
MNTWDRQENESSKAYAAFLMYLELGPSRSIVKVRQSIGKNPVYNRQLERWSSKWLWVERTKAFDKNIAMGLQEALIAEHLAMNKRHIETSRELQSQSLIRIRSLDEEKVSVADSLRMFEAGVKLERLAFGAPSEVMRQEVSGPGGVAITVRQEYDFSQLAPDEIILLKSLLERCRNDQ